MVVLASFPRRRRIVGAFRSRQEFGRVLQHILIRAAGHRRDSVLLKHGQPVVFLANVLLDILVWSLIIYLCLVGEFHL